MRIAACKYEIIIIMPMYMLFVGENFRFVFTLNDIIALHHMSLSLLSCQSCKCMLGEITQWVSVAKDTVIPPSQSQPRLLAWMECLFIRLSQELLIVWLGLLYHLKGTYYSTINGVCSLFLSPAFFIDLHIKQRRKYLAQCGQYSKQYYLECWQ